TEEPAAKTVAFQAPEVKTFDEAFEKAEEAADEMKTSQFELDFVKKQTPSETAEIEQLEQAVKRQQEMSFAMIKRAVELADVNTDPAKLQTAYYLLSFFNYQNGNYLEAALVGEHLARKFPESNSAQPAARVALASFDA